MDRGAWQATVHGVEKESDMTEQLTYYLPMYYSLYYITPQNVLISLLYFLTIFHHHYHLYNFKF